jgi:hypothetical protein
MLALAPLMVMTFWLVKLRRRKDTLQMSTPPNPHPQGALDGVRTVG